MSAVLADYRVLDLTDERGALCGQLFADLGADVLRIEPPGGSPMRASLAWEVYARNCASAVLDLATRRDRETLESLAAEADVIVTGPAALVDGEELRAHNERLVHVAITPFGRTGPKRDYAATDLIVQAASGAMAITGFDDGKPLRTGCITAWSHAGVAAAGGALLALRQRDHTGAGQLVDVSAQLACNLSASYSLLTPHVGASRIRRASPTAAAFPFIWPAKDGFVSMTLGFAGPMMGFARNLLAWLEHTGAIDSALASLDWPAYVSGLRPGGDVQPLQQLKDGIASFLVARTKGELLAGAIEHGVLIVPASTTHDLLESPQLAARGHWWQSRGATFPGPFAHFNTQPIVLKNPAPALDVATPQFRTAVTQRGQTPPRNSADAPLAGIKILDFTWVMAGPWSTRVLADYGATVIKVESRKRLDLVRILGPFYHDKLTPESSASFASINAGKLSLELDPGTPEGKTTILELVDWADVVVESFSPKAMKKWGLDYASLAARKPALVMLSTCLFGQTGPYASIAGYGTMGAALGGLVLPTGTPDRAPCGPFGPYTDYVAPRFSVVAMLAALHYRDRTGEGQYIDQSQAESAMQFLSIALATTSRGAPAPDRLANSDADYFPHDVFRCEGDDQWIAIAVRDEHDWHALVEVTGSAELADSSLDDVAARRTAAPSIDRAISAWTSTRTAIDLERMLQNVGVPAHAVANAGAEPDAQLVHREHFVHCAHAVHGDAIVESVGYRLSAAVPCVGRVPSLGGDGERVMREILRR